MFKQKWYFLSVILFVFIHPDKFPVNLKTIDLKQFNKNTIINRYLQNSKIFWTIYRVLAAPIPIWLHWTISSTCRKAQWPVVIRRTRRDRTRWLQRPMHRIHKTPPKHNPRLNNWECSSSRYRWQCMPAFWTTRYWINRSLPRLCCYSTSYWVRYE